MKPEVDLETRRETRELGNENKNMDRNIGT
jgi:hypothetical protein